MQYPTKAEQLSPGKTVEGLPSVRQGAPHSLSRSRSGPDVRATSDPPAGGADRATLRVRDGVPLYDRGPALEDIWGTTTIDPHMIERVEVFRGGNSLFFGSNGGIGVVSLVTTTPDGPRTA